MSAAKDPVSFPQPARDTASRAHPRRLHCRQPFHQPCAGRHSKIYNCQLFTNKGLKLCILVSAIFVCSSSGLDYMRRRHFANAQIEKPGEYGGIHDVSCVDECSRGWVGELGEAGDGLLRSDEGANRIGVEIFVEIGKLERERVVGRIRGHSSAFTDSTRETSAVQGSGSYHCKRQHLGYPTMPWLGRMHSQQCQDPRSRFVHRSHWQCYWPRTLSSRSGQPCNLWPQKF